MGSLAHQNTWGLSLIMGPAPPPSPTGISWIISHDGIPRPPGYLGIVSHDGTSPPRLPGSLGLSLMMGSLAHQDTWGLSLMMGTPPPLAHRDLLDCLSLLDPSPTRIPGDCLPWWDPPPSPTRIPGTVSHNGIPRSPGSLWIVSHNGTSPPRPPGFLGIVSHYETPPAPPTRTPRDCLFWRDPPPPAHQDFMMGRYPPPPLLTRNLAHRDIPPTHQDSWKLLLMKGPPHQEPRPSGFPGIVSHDGHPPHRPGPLPTRTPAHQDPRPPGPPPVCHVGNPPTSTPTHRNPRGLFLWVVMSPIYTPLCVSGVSSRSLWSLINIMHPPQIKSQVSY